MPQKTIERALREAEKLGLDLHVGVLNEIQRFDAKDLFSPELTENCERAMDLLREEKNLPLANQLHAACVELCPASFSL